MADQEQTDEELEKELDKVAVGEPIDLGDDPIETISLKDIPPGPERDEAERLLAELRSKRERETGNDQKPVSGDAEASPAASASGAGEPPKGLEGKRGRRRPVDPSDRRVDVVALGPKAAAAYGRQRRKGR